MKRNVPHGVTAAVVAAVTTLFVMLVGQPAYSPASQAQNFLPTTGTYSGLQSANYINGALDALMTCNKGAVAPTNALGGAAVAGQCWLDDSSATLLIKKRYSGSAWVVEGVIDVSNGVWSPPVGGGTGTVNAATTTDLCSAPQSVINVASAATVTSFGSNCSTGVRKTLVFATAVTLTHNATSLIIPGQANYTTSAGDVIEAVALGAGNWRVVGVNPVSGLAVKNPATPVCTQINYMGSSASLGSKYALAKGQALLRSSYPDYLACATSTQSVSRTNGSRVLTGFSATDEFSVGMPVEGTGIQAGSTIASIDSGTQITLNVSHAATSTGTANVVVFLYGYGAGGDSTTVGLMDCQGNKIAGRDTSATRLTAFAGLNVLKGAETHALTATELPSISPTFTGGTPSFTGTGATITSNSVNPDIVRAASTSATIQTSGSTSTYNNVPTGAVGQSVQSQASYTPAGAISQVTGTVGSFGGNAAHSLLDPTLSSNCAIAVLP